MDLLLDGRIALVTGCSEGIGAGVDALLTEARAVGEIDILVNNAGGSGGTSDWSSTEASAWASS